MKINKNLRRVVVTLSLIGAGFVYGKQTGEQDILKARDIETRYMNYPTKRNYKQDDLERIIYGKR